MEKKSKIRLAFLLVLVMVMTTACFESSDEVRQPGNVNGETTAASDSPAAVDEAITVAETVLYDADGIVVTATGYEDGWMGPGIKVLVENNTDRNVLVTTQSVSVNGYMIPYASLYAEVAAGKKSNESISLMSSELEQSGIETVAELQFYIRVSDSETWETLATSALITLNTSAAGYAQPVDDSGDVLYDAGGIRVICKGLKQDVVWDCTVVFYVENNSGEPITVCAENVSVNGFMEDASLWSELRDGTRIIDGLSLLNLSDLGLESIDDVKNIAFNLRIINSETWHEIVTTDEISLDFE